MKRLIIVSLLVLWLLIPAHSIAFRVQVTQATEVQQFYNLTLTIKYNKITAEEMDKILGKAHRGCPKPCKVEAKVKSIDAGTLLLHFNE